MKPAADPAQAPVPEDDLQGALNNLREAVDLFCVAYGEARQASCPAGLGDALTVELLEQGLREEPAVLERPGVAERHGRLRRQWQEWVRIPRNRERVEISLGGHHGTAVLERYARRLAETSGRYVHRINAHRFEPARRRQILPRPGGRIVIITGDDAGWGLELHTTASHDWQTGAIASYLKMANPALLGDYTIG